MDSLSHIKAILSEADAKEKQDANAKEKKAETAMPKMPEQKKETVLTAPGTSEIKKASNAAPTAKHPMNDPKAKNSSSKQSLGGPSSHSEENESELEPVTEGEEESEKSEKSEKGESFAERMKRIRNMRKNKKSGKSSSDDEKEDGEKEDGKKEKKEVEESFDAGAHLTALFESDTSLTEESKSRLATIFNTALAEREMDLREEISDEFSDVIAESVNEMENELTNQINDYLNYVVTQWVTENRLEIENGVRNELSESLLLGMRSLFLEHNIDVPESKVDVVEQLIAQNKELEEKLNEETINNVNLSSKLEELEKDQIISQIGESLADTEFDKFVKLSESVSYDTKEDLEAKLKIIKESYFGKKASGNKKPNTSETKPSLISESASATVEEDHDGISNEEVKEISEESTDKNMNAYVKTLSRFRSTNNTKK